MPVVKLTTTLPHPSPLLSFIDTINVGQFKQSFVQVIEDPHFGLGKFYTYNTLLGGYSSQVIISTIRARHTVQSLRQIPIITLP